jgi:hypothetical protein
MLSLLTGCTSSEKRFFIFIPEYFVFILVFFQGSKSMVAGCESSLFFLSGKLPKPFRCELPLELSKKPITEYSCQTIFGQIDFCLLGDKMLVVNYYNQPY